MKRVKIDIIAYGIAKDIIGGNTRSMELDGHTTVNELLNLLKREHPKLEKLKSLAVALNEEYAEGHEVISQNDEVVLIPPVSGG